MKGRLVSADAISGPLPESLDAGVEVLAGEPTATHLPLEPFGSVAVGVWELTPGRVRDIEADEVLVILAGRGTVEFEHGETIALAPGVVIRLEAGDRTVWTVTEPLRKFYIAR